MKLSRDNFFAFVLGMFLGLVCLYFVTHRPIQQITEFTKISDKVGISSNILAVGKDIEKKAQDAFDINKPFSNIQNFNNATYLIRSYARKNASADFSYVKDGKTKYLFHEIHLKDKNGDGPAIGYVMIYDSGLVVSGVYKFKLQVNTLVQKNSDKYLVTNGANLIMLQSGLANRKDSSKKDWKNIPYPLDIQSADNFINLDYAVDRFSFGIMPDLGVAGVSSINEFNSAIMPSVGVSFLRLGRDGLQSFRFLRVGLGMKNKQDSVNINVMPVLYNLHGIVPIFRNTFVGPILGYDKSSLNIGAGLTLGF